MTPRHVDAPAADPHRQPPPTLRVAQRLGFGNRRVRCAAAGVAFLLGSGLVAVLFYSPGDLDGFRWPMAEMVLHGQPLLVYTVHSGPWRSDDGPLGLVPLTAVAALANGLGWQNAIHLRADLAIGLFGVFSLLLAREAVLAIEAVRGPLRRPLVAAAPFLLAPPLWIGIVGYGHVDLPIELWLTLLSVRLLGRDAPVRAGFCLGLAVLTRTTVLLSAIRSPCSSSRTGACDRRRPWPARRRSPSPQVCCRRRRRYGRRRPVAGHLSRRGPQPRRLLLAASPGHPRAGFAQHWDTVTFGGAAVIVTAAPSGGGPARPSAPPASTRSWPSQPPASPSSPSRCGRTTWSIPAPSQPCGGLGRPQPALNWRVVCPALLAACSVVLAVHPPAAAGDKVVEGVDCSLAVALAMALILGDWLATGERPRTGSRRVRAGRLNRRLPLPPFPARRRPARRSSRWGWASGSGWRWGGCRCRTRRRARRRRGSTTRSGSPGC